MKKASLLLLIFVSLTAFTCENEPLDFEVEEAVSSNLPGNPAALIGTWRAVSLEGDIQNSTSILGISASIDADVLGSNMDYLLTFTENSYTVSGDYDVTVTTSFNGETPISVTDSYTNQTDSGTYQNTGPGVITLNEPFYTYSSGIDTSAIDGEPVEMQYSISADGQTLTFIQNQQDAQDVDGVSFSLSVMSTSVFTRE